MRPKTTTTPTPIPGEIDMILADLRETGRSCASDRALRLAKAALRGLTDDLRTEVTS